MEVFLSVEEGVNLLGISKQAFHKNRRAGKYVAKEVKVNGGISYEIALTSLPQEAQNRYQAQKLQAVMVQVVAKEPEVKAEPLPVTEVDLFALTERQREIGRCRKRIVDFIQTCGLKVIPAITHINKEWADKTLPSAMQYALEHASDKGEPTELSRKTYYNWTAHFKKHGTYAPLKKQKDMSVKPWHRMAVALYARPQKPTFKYVEERLAEHFSPAPSYHQIEAFFNEKYSQSDLNKGRHTGMKLKSLQFYQKRTHAGMLPWDEIHADGWATHFTAPHPVTGDYVTLEVWDFHDVATRYVPPFAIGLSENFEVIAKGIENAIRDGGVMAILQTDSSKIIKNNAKFTGNPLVSISDRAGITIVHPVTVGNAQANGISENFHSWLDKEARELATYQAQGTKHDTGMDSLSLRRTQKLTAQLLKSKAVNDAQKVDELRREIAKTAKGLLFESYQQAVDWLEAKRQKWNNHEHSSLEKIRDVKTGRLRYQTPLEALNAFKENGWQPVAMDEAHIVDLFRPRVQLKVRRGVVKPYGQMRFRHNDLDHYEGEDVVVSYDIMDYEKVWVYDLKGSLIAVAPYCADAPYRAQTAQEAAEVKRALAQIKRKESQIETIKEQRLGGLTLEHLEAQVIEVKRFRPVQEEPEEVVQLSRAEAIQRMAAWKTVEEDEDFNQNQEEKNNAN